MKQWVRQTRLMLLTVAVLMGSIASAFAQNPGEKVTSGVQAGGHNHPALTTARMKVAKPTVENKQRELLDELLEPETAQQTERTGKEVPCALAECTSTPATGGIANE